MKLHRPLLEAVTDILCFIFLQGQHAESIIEASFRAHPKWGSRDRRFIAENVYDIVRNCRRLCHAVEIDTPKSRKEVWHLAGLWYATQGLEIPDWVVWLPLDLNAAIERYQLAQNVRALRESVPDWLDELGLATFGTEWDKELSALNGSADVVLRANALKTSRTFLSKLLKDEGIESTPFEPFPDALRLLKRQQLAHTETFKLGLFEVQDAASQAVAPFLRCKGGMTVIDACAGAGGKTLHLTAIMRNKGRVVAMDIDAEKLDILQERARKAGAKIIETYTITSADDMLAQWHETADRLLLDVPCSGIGVLRRTPDAKWRLSPDALETICQTQAQILDTYSNMLRPGGLMVYATCSLLAVENQVQVERFLERHPDTFELVQTSTFTPAQHQTDGFYMALIKKNALVPPSPSDSSST